MFLYFAFKAHILSGTEEREKNNGGPIPSYFIYETRLED